jgi:hypothetical protein
MDLRVAVAGLIASLAIACGDSTGGLAGGAMPDAGDQDQRIDEGVIDGLLDAGGDGDLADAAELEPDAAVDAGEPEPDASSDGALVPACPGGDRDDDGICNGEDVCDGHDDTADDDADGMPDGCDECPVGHVSFCDAVIWKIEMPYDDYPVAENAGEDWFWAFNLEAADDGYQVQLDLEADNVLRSYELGSSELDEVRDFFGQHDTMDATLGFVTSPQGGGALVTASVQSPCPFVPSAAVIKRISVSGMMSLSGSGYVTVEVRGYVTEP